MAVKIVDTKNTTIESRISRKGSTGTGEQSISIKDSSGNTIVTASKKGSSTTVQQTTTGIYDSTGKILPSAISGDPNIKGDKVYIYKGNSKLLKSYQSQDAQNYLKQKYAEQESRKAAEAKAKAAQQQTVTPVTVPTHKLTYTTVSNPVPTPVNPSYSAEWTRQQNEALNALKAAEEKKRLNEAAKNLNPSTISALKPTSTVSKGIETLTTLTKDGSILHAHDIAPKLFPLPISPTKSIV